jgi:hypothetical protein
MIDSITTCRNRINTVLNGIKIKEKCSTPYKHFITCYRKEDGDIGRRCVWCHKTIHDIAEENNIEELKIRGFYQTQIEWV